MFLNANRYHYLVLAGLILTVLVLFTYWGAGKNDFVSWDDNDYVVNNKIVRNQDNSGLKEIFSTVVSLNYHPITILSLRLNNNVCKTCPNEISAKPFILTNVALHLSNTILVLILIYLLSSSNLTAAIIAAAIFGVHPMHVESVAWISERKDVLYSFFFLSGLITYFFFKTKSGRKSLWFISTFILFVLSCLSKATAVIFPVVLVLMNFWIIKIQGKEKIQNSFVSALSGKNLLILLPFFAVSIFLGLMTTRIQGGNNFLGFLKFIKEPQDVINIAGSFSVFQRFQIASYGFIIYIVKFFIPINLSTLHPYPAFQDFSHGSFNIILWLSVLSVIAIIFFTLKSLRKTKLYVFGLGFYFITIALVLQFVSVGRAIMAERYSYLPYIGFAFIPAMLIAESPKTKRTLLLVISACFIVLMMFLSRSQVKVWRNSGTLWTQVIKRYPNLEYARGARGKYYYMLSAHAKNQNTKNILEDKALTDFKEAIRYGTINPDVYEASGVIYQTRGDLKNALLLLNKAISLDPEKGRAYYNRAMVFDMMNRKEESIKDYNSALDLSPDLTLEILSNRSVLFLETGKFEDAIHDLDRLITLNGNDHRYFSNRAFARLKLNDFAGAIEDYQKVLQLNPDDQTTRNQLQILINNHIR